MYAIYEILANYSEAVKKKLENVRKSLDGSMCICDYPECAIGGIEPARLLSTDEAIILVGTSEWQRDIETE